MKDFKKLVDTVIERADIVLMVVDARRANESINKEMERKIKQKGKKILYVINKCDLLTRDKLKQVRLHNSIKISAKEHMRTTLLIKKINQLAGGKEVTVGVVGLPNTGKSTIINALKGRKSAPTSPISSFTRGIQKIRITSRIMMIDTPGVLSKLTDNSDIIMIGAVDADKINDPESAAENLIESLDGKIEDYFGVEVREDKMDTLEEIAIKKNIIKKGRKPDTKRMAREIIRLCQRGGIKI